MIGLLRLYDFADVLRLETELSEFLSVHRKIAASPAPAFTNMCQQP